MDNYLQPSIGEPVEIRAHHLRTWAIFLGQGGSEHGLAMLYGRDREKDDFKGYGRPFLTNVANVFTYLTRNPEARVKITDSFDALCNVCPKNPLNDLDGTCDNISTSRSDESYAERCGVVIGREYTWQEIIEKTLKEADKISWPEQKRIKFAIRSLQSAGNK